MDIEDPLREHIYKCGKWIRYIVLQDGKILKKTWAELWEYNLEKGRYEHYPWKLIDEQYVDQLPAKAVYQESYGVYD